MLVATSQRGQPVLQTDGDASFWKVDNRTPAHQLPEGVAAEAINMRLDEGRPRPRYGVALGPWGQPHPNLIRANGTYQQLSPNPDLWFYIVTLTVGQRYVYIQGNSTALSSSTPALSGSGPGPGVIPPGAFVATQLHYYLYGAPSNPVTAKIFAAANTLAYGRFSDPNGFDNCVLVTDEPRSTDGGVGRAWRIIDNNPPQEIPMNGNDIWGPSNVVQCYNGLLLLRDGNERHYFNAAAVGTNEIQLNCQPAFVNGDEVQLVPTAPGSAILGTSAPNLDAPYFVNNLSNNQIALYDTRAHAVAGGGTGKLAFNTATGAFYVERISTQAGFYGNGAPVLILQGNDNNTPFDLGFVAVPVSIAVTNTDNTTNILTAPNHRLVPGDAVVFTGTITGITDGTTYYARPLSNDLFQVYDTALHALAGGATGQVVLSTSNQTGTVAKVNASGQPIAPARLGIAFLGRSILVNQRNNVLISDPNDPVHFTPMNATLNANLGENDEIVALMTAPYDTLIIIKANKTVLAIANLSQANTQWLQYEVTREYGGVAALATAHKGTERWFLSRRGIDRVRSSITGNVQGVALPVSADIQGRFGGGSATGVTGQIDWLHASQSCAEEWNNRIFFAVPLKGQTGTIVNNGVLVYSIVASPPGPQGESEPGGWEDLWTGASLTPFAFSKLTVNGEERLTFATANGQVCWFSDDFQDEGPAGPATAIYTRLVTRAYFQGAVVLALKGEVNWDTYAPNLTVSVRTAGVNEQSVILSRTYDKTKYQIANAGTYDPTHPTPTGWAAPHRADYSLTAGELLAGTLDTMQNTTEPLRLRTRDRSPQIIIENSAGAVAVNSVTVAARAVQTIGQTT